MNLTNTLVRNKKEMKRSKEAKTYWKFLTEKNYICWAENKSSNGKEP